MLFPAVVVRSSGLRALQIASGGTWRTGIAKPSGWRPKRCLTTDVQLSRLQVDKERLMRDIHHTCQFGPGQRWGPNESDIGMSRASLSDDDRRARDWFVETTRQLGCEVSIDAMGNIFAVRRGRLTGPPTCAGSHLDTQPSGGRYDGILGVCAGVEMLRLLHEEQIETDYPIGVINWTNEEGSRFPISMVSSGVWAGQIPIERAHNLKEVGGGSRTMKEELKRIGYLGKVSASHEAMPIGAHFELHIEQGPRLEVERKAIGVVHGVQAYRWHTVLVKGRDCHTGTTDFANRADAMLTAAKMILHSHRLATKHSSLASTGILTLRPGSTNTVPGTVQFSLDIRAGEDDRLIQLEDELKIDFDRIAKGVDVDGLNAGGTTGRPCSVEWTLDAPSKAVKFHPDCIRCVEESAGAQFGDQTGSVTQAMISGAGHDSVFTSSRVPTSMIFVPCRDGVSHNPAEYCASEDCATGAQVLMGAVLRYDRLRAQRATQ